MGSHIWGNIYLYCWEHQIDFREVFNELRNIELQAYKDGCKQFMIPFNPTKYESLNEVSTPMRGHNSYGGGI